MLKQPEKVYLLKIRSIIGEGDNREDEETWTMYKSLAGLQKAYDKWSHMGDFIYWNEIMTITGYEAKLESAPILFKVIQ